MRRPSAIEIGVCLLTVAILASLAWLTLSAYTDCRDMGGTLLYCIRSLG